MALLNRVTCIDPQPLGDVIDQRHTLLAHAHSYFAPAIGRAQLFPIFECP
jgi:hypothetical protein